MILIDDDLCELNLLKEIIVAADYGIEIAAVFTDGNEAVAYLETNTVDIVISDVKMPTPNGIDIAHICHESYPATKVILISGYSDFEDARKAIEYNVVNYIKKPIDYNILHQTLLNVTDRLSISEIFPQNEPNIIVDNFVSYVKSHIASILNSSISETYKKACLLILELMVTSETLEDGEGKSKTEKSEMYDPLSNDILSKAIEYMENNLNKKISLSDVAEYVHISPKYFSRYFKNKLEKKFIDVLTDMRMNKAKHLLQDTDYPVEKICDLVGYASTSHFYSTFRDYFGVTPNTFRI